MPVREGRQEIAPVGLTVPVFAPVGAVGREAQLRDPVGQRASGVEMGPRDRIADELLVGMAGHEHGPAGQERRALGDRRATGSRRSRWADPRRDRSAGAPPSGCRRRRSPGRPLVVRPSGRRLARSTKCRVGRADRPRWSSRRCWPVTTASWPSRRHDARPAAGRAGGRDGSRTAARVAGGDPARLAPDLAARAC